ncbi:anti-sigma factor family protein [Paracoccus lutimaris]|uniref:Anti-sigma factor n=1 Tax=Paracoccus lutimaris TaxID=1490030 RepID=A0A368Z5T1_9RHOB|nr:hypothetical protein [Paracoccus lutimaris]RCW87138.1 hypothetical protein DFP89_103142 [Paracoccus lutimaris]
MQISDETLMALADNELDAQTARRVSQAVRDDPALAARLARFTRTRELLAQSIRAGQGGTQGAEDPLAAMIRAGITKPAVKPAVKPAEKPAEKPAPANLNRRPILAAAASMAIAAIGLGWWGWSNRLPDGLSVPELAALDSLPSGESRMLDAGAELTMIASFRSAAGALCREFETAQAARTRIVLACHESGGWHERFAATAQQDATGGYQPASGEGSIDDALAQIGASAPLTPEEEAAALGGNPPG